MYANTRDYVQNKQERDTIRTKKDLDVSSLRSFFKRSVPNAFPEHSIRWRFPPADCRWHFRWNTFASLDILHSRRPWRYAKVSHRLSHPEYHCPRSGRERSQSVFDVLLLVRTDRCSADGRSNRSLECSLRSQARETHSFRYLSKTSSHGRSLADGAHLSCQTRANARGIDQNCIQRRAASRTDHAWFVFLDNRKTNRWTGSTHIAPRLYLWIQRQRWLLIACSRQQILRVASWMIHRSTEHRPVVGHQRWCLRSVHPEDYSIRDLGWSIVWSMYRI